MGGGGADGGAAAADAAPALRLLPWAASNHEVVLFSKDCANVAFLSIDGRRMEHAMHPHLLAHLRANGVKVGEGLAALNARHHEVLGTLTGVCRTAKEAHAVLGGAYCITGDALLKMLAIHVRARCGLPVVLCGECGCGKTMLLRFLAEWLRVHLLVLDVHGGTTVADIEGIFARADALLRADDLARAPHAVDGAGGDDGARGAARDGDETRVIVFLDELNASHHVTLLAEAISSRSLFGSPIPRGVQLFAAINPHRKRPAEMRAESAGLVFNLHTAPSGARGGGGGGAGASGFGLDGSEAPPDPMSELVYRVHPIPATLEQFVFDFGSLGVEEEGVYVKSIVARELTKLARRAERADDAGGNGGGGGGGGGEAGSGVQLTNVDAQCVAAMLIASQRHVREVERDASVVSLRDVQRCCNLLAWFCSKLVPRQTERSAGAAAAADAAGAPRPISQLAVATVLALSFAYLYRLPRRSERAGYWGAMRAALVLRSRGVEKSKAWLGCGFARLSASSALERVLEQTQRKVTSHLSLEPDVALNGAPRPAAAARADVLPTPDVTPSSPPSTPSPPPLKPIPCIWQQFCAAVWVGELLAPSCPSARRLGWANSSHLPAPLRSGWGGRTPCTFLPLCAAVGVGELLAPSCPSAQRQRWANSSHLPAPLRSG